MKLDKIRYHLENISPQRTQSSQRLFKIFFLSDLCALCGEPLWFFHDQTGRFFGQRRRLYETLSRMAETVKPPGGLKASNLEHRTPNIER